MAKRLSFTDCHELLEAAFEKYNNTSFIKDDPISIPHQYDILQDIEIVGFWTAMLSWGRRTTIINKATELFKMMDNAPYDFVMNHKPKDLMTLEKFKHRTFNATDTLYFISFFKNYYAENHSLETLFISELNEESPVEHGLNKVHKQFFALPYAPHRTKKHVSCPAKKSTCKRLNMFLRWMVRSDDKGVDFGLWKKINPAELKIPYDVHVENVARSLGLIKRKQRDWQTVIELTDRLKKFDPDDPVKYDFALFGMGVVGE